MNRQLSAHSPAMTPATTSNLVTPNSLGRGEDPVECRAEPPDPWNGHRAGPATGRQAITVARREGPGRIVVIDDSSDLRALLGFALSRAGMDVVGEAGDGQAGVEVVREERPDVGLLGLSMPVMDGVEALPLIRELVPDGRIIVFSGFDAALTQQVLESGADGHVVKGTPLKDIIAYVEKLLGD